MPASSLIFAFLLTVCFTLATWLQPWHQGWAGGRSQSGSLLDVVVGDSRKLFANHFFVRADVYFHSGYYPSIFDQAIGGAPHMTAVQTTAAGSDAAHESEPAEGTGFLGPPRDWIDRFGRNFYPSHHSHLDKPGEAREILPWLRIAADLDPHKVETYTVAAYWLRQHLNKVDDAEQFLREGWRANPDSYEILFELGRVFEENRHDAQRARNVFELALRKWQERAAREGNQNEFLLEQILAHLAEIESREGHFEKALSYLGRVKEISPRPDAIQQQIDELKRKMAPNSAPENSNPDQPVKP